MIHSKTSFDLYEEIQTHGLKVSMDWVILINLCVVVQFLKTCMYAPLGIKKRLILKLSKH